MRKSKNLRHFFLIILEKAKSSPQIQGGMKGNKKGRGVLKKILRRGSLRLNLKSQKGAALLMILALSSLLIPLVQSVWLDTQIEYRFSRSRMSSLQARWNAKAAADLSFIRIYIYKGVEKSLSDKSPLKELLRPLIDRIWNFPLSLPPPIPEDMLKSDKDLIEKLKEESFLKGSHTGIIKPEDGLLDLNDLSSSLPFLRAFTYDSLLNLLSLEVEKQAEEQPEEQDWDWNERYSRDKLERLLNHLSDWTDLDLSSQNGGREDQVEEGKRPLNRSFVSITEIKKVPEMTVELFEILKPHVTVYGGKALNLNYASKDVLLALNISEELADSILARTDMSSPYYEPFTGETDFCDFIDELGFAFCDNLKEYYQTLDMLTFSSPVSFRVQSLGSYRNQLIKLETLLYDLSPPAIRYQRSRHFALQREREAQNSATGGRSRPSPSPAHQSSANDDSSSSDNKAKAFNFNYSSFNSLSIMYWKEEMQ